MPLLPKQVYFNDYIFNVWENVYEPAEDSFLFAENLNVKKAETILDIGSGCGILGILAAEKAKSVLSVDVNPYAIRCTKENVKRNGLRNKIFCVQGDLFAPLSERYKFDVVLFNAPYVPTEENETESWIGRAWAGGATGRKVIDRFIVQTPNHLKQKGRVLLMQSTLTSVDESLSKFEDNNMNAKVVAELALPFFETIKLIEAKL